MTFKVSVAARRGRLVERQLLGAPVATVGEVAESLVALHATDPVTVYLSARARSRCAVEDVDAALYEERAMVRMLGMRRTVFVVPAGLADVVQAACTDDVARRMRRQLEKDLAGGGVGDGDAGAWLRSRGGRGAAGAGGAGRRRDRGAAVGRRAAAADAAGLRAGQGVRRGRQHHVAGARADRGRGAHDPRAPARAGGRPGSSSGSCRRRGCAVARRPAMRRTVPPTARGHARRGPGRGPRRRARRGGRADGTGAALAVRLRAWTGRRPAVVGGLDGRPDQGGARGAAGDRGRPRRAGRGRAGGRP